MRTGRAAHRGHESAGVCIATEPTPPVARRTTRVVLRGVSNRGARSVRSSWRVKDEETVNVPVWAGAARHPPPALPISLQGHVSVRVCTWNYARSSPGFRCLPRHWYKGDLKGAAGAPARSEISLALRQGNGSMKSKARSSATSRSSALRTLWLAAVMEARRACANAA